MAEAQEPVQIEIPGIEETPRRGRPPKHSAYKPTGEAESASSRRGIQGAGGLKELRFPLNDQGNIDVEKMRADTLEFARKLLSDPAQRQALGITEEQLLKFVLTDEDIQFLYQITNAVEVFIATRFRGIPEDIAIKHIPMTPVQIETVKEPTKAMAAKYIPASWLAKKDETMFFGILLMLKKSNWDKATEETKRRNEQNKLMHVESRPAEDKQPDTIV